MSRRLRVAVRLILAGLLCAGAATWADEKPARARLTVLVPRDDAELSLDEKYTRGTGPMRHVQTPELAAGKTYEYAVKVSWRPNNYTVITRARTVEFKAGDELKLDLTKPIPGTPDKLVVRYVPTPPDIVPKVIELAKITPDDVYYEPGAGDGRVLIAAVKAGARKAVGIELDAKKLIEAIANVREAGLHEKITVVKGDALVGQDYSEATVLYLSLGNEFNNALLPIFQKQLKPGTRIISRRYVFAGWPPDRTLVLTGADEEEHKLHLWTVKDPR